MHSIQVTPKEKEMVLEKTSKKFLDKTHDLLFLFIPQFRNYSINSSSLFKHSNALLASWEKRDDNFSFLF